MNSKNEKTLPLGLQMLGPALMVLGVMLPWGAFPEAQGLDRWGLVVLLVGVPALLLPWAARETVAAHRILAGLALIAAIGALGGWMAAWQTISAAIPDPVTRVGKGPLFTLAGVALTWATLPGPLRGWHRVLAVGGGFGLMLAIAMLMSAWLSAEKEASAAMGGAALAPVRTPWIMIEVRPSSETPAMRRVEQEQPSPAMPTATPLPFSYSGSETGPEPGGFSSPEPAMATPEDKALETPSPLPPTLAPTATVPPLSPPSPSPTPPPSPLSP